MSRSAALHLVTIIWAAVYLPALGTLEIRGEEGRRILPAVTMLETGNYLVPQVGSDPYFRKPPLVNWLVAGSFKLFGARNEWAARLPSALCVLAVAVAFVTVARGALGANGALIAALVWLINFGTIEKGRLIEIEALYVSLTGLAVISWLVFWQQQRSRWLTWTLPWVFLGLGLLAKGPLHLFFFYAVVLGVLYHTRNLRELLRIPHMIGVVLMLLIFAAWAVPCFIAVEGTNVGHIWARQFSGRLSGEDFNFSGWILNIPRGIGYFLPWVLLLLFSRRAEFVDERDRRIARGIRWGIGISFVVVSLLPGSLSRYTMPLLTPACWMLAALLCAERIDLPRWLRLTWPPGFAPPLRLPLVVAAIACAGVSTYALCVVPRLKKNEKVRTIAEQIDATIPPNERLYAVDPDFQPFLFYVRTPLTYVTEIANVPAEARYVLVQPKKETEAESTDRWAPRRAEVVRSFVDYRNHKTALLKIE
jgi:4-amino-4-deoxy-L-arabinose transferase-like glycosyltransferase